MRLTRVPIRSCVDHTCVLILYWIECVSFYSTRHFTSFRMTMKVCKTFDLFTRLGTVTLSTEEYLSWKDTVLSTVCTKDK